MIAYVKSTRDDNENRKNYHCAHCGILIAHGSSLIAVNGAREHSYINPAGVQCNFMTFSHCDNVIVHEDLYLEHSWFAGYGWRFLICEGCFQHLGWKYDSLGKTGRPDGFFGVLIGSVKAVSGDN
jgi:hypothetical protein